MSSLNPVFLKTLQSRRQGLNTRSNAPGGQVATSTSTSAFGVPSSAFAKASGDNSQPASITIDESVETYAGGDPTRTVGDTAQPILDEQGLFNLGTDASVATAPPVTTSEAPVTTPNAKTPSDPRVNRLHDYAPYNYVITFSCVSPGRLNSGSGEEILIFKSAGKGKQGSGPLSVDYYVDNLVVRNTVSPSLMAGTTTAYQVLFEVTEPYGVSFVDALIKAAKQLGYVNHLKAVYLVKIEFKGIDDDGNPTANIPKTTREIPVHLYQLEMQVEAGASTYAVQAVPASSLALTALHIATLETVQCSGDTVGQLVTDFFRQYNATKTKNLKANKVDSVDDYQLDVESSKLALLKSKIGYDTQSASSSVLHFSNGAPPGVGVGTRSVTVPKGTSIQAFLEAVVRESEFYRTQFDLSGNPLSKNGFLRILKLFTQLKIKKSNNANNRPSYTFSYIMRDQQVSASYMDKTSRDLVSGVNPARTYNYLYTGANQDILDFDVTYKFAYFEAASQFKDNDGSKSDTDSFDGTGKNTSENDGTKGASATDIDSITKEIQDVSNSNLFPNVTKQNGELATIFEAIIMDPSADLIVVNMEIIGDPYWIEQKSVSNLPLKNTHVADSPNIDANGAVVTDEYEVYIRVNFKTPTDLDDTSGLFKIGDAAFFSGIYKVYMCEHRFSGGVYTNVLQMVRMRHQQSSTRKFTDMDQPNAMGGPIPSTTSNATDTTSNATDTNNMTIGDRVVDFEELDDTLNVKKVTSGLFKGRKTPVVNKNLTRNTNTNPTKRLGGGN